MQAILANDPVIQGLEAKAAEHHAKELERIAALQTSISTAWQEVRDLKSQRGLLNRAIANRTTAIRAMVRRTKLRKPTTINRRLAARKLTLRRREEIRLARAVTRQAIQEFRKKMGIPAAGVLPQ